MRDFEYFKSLYPREAKRLQLLVEATVDEVDYEGSPIYDEYPDRFFLEQLTNQAAEETAGTVPEMTEIEGNGYRMWEPQASFKQEMQAQERRNRPPQRPLGPPGPPPPPPPDRWDFMNVLLMNELLHRRFLKKS